MSFRNLKIGTRILSGFSIILLIALVIGVIGIAGLTRIGAAFHVVGDERLPAVQFLAEMEANLHRIATYSARLLDTQLDRGDRDQLTRDIGEARARFDAAQGQYAGLDRNTEEEQAYAQMNEAFRHWELVNAEQVEPAHNRFLEIDLMDPVSSNRDIELFMREMAQLQIRALNGIEDMQPLRARFEDPMRSSFGPWAAEFQTSNERLTNILGEIRKYHAQVHAAVAMINEAISRNDQAAARRIYEQELVPATVWGIRMFGGFNAVAEEAVEALAELSQTIATDALAAQEAVQRQLAQLVALAQEGAEEELRLGDQIIAQANAVNIGAMVIGAIIAVVLGLLITRQITTGINSGVGMAKRIADGDLTVKADQALLAQKDEIGELVQAMDRMSRKLREIIGSVVTGADNITAASQQTSSTAQSLSQGASEQAASVEETTASVEQMSASIEQNTENAKVTDTMASKAATDAGEGGEAVRKTVDAMKSIAEKISIIDDIAYQTNLLALNAAIEAARAGEHGKGFAVVAAEVRKLAERSQVASQEIGEVAKGSVSLAEKAGELLDEIVPAIQKTSDLVQEISAASTEQSSGANQINQAMEQLNSITQQSASSSEELASTSEEMNGQAEQLQQLVSFFNIDGGSASRGGGFSMSNNPPPKGPEPQRSESQSAPATETSDDEAGFVRF